MTIIESGARAEQGPTTAPVWTSEEVAALFALPFADLLHRAQRTHRENFDPNALQLSTLLNIKTGGCPEDCKYCAQSVHYETGLDAGKLMEAGAICAVAARAKEAGATRFCMGAAWRKLNDRHVDAIAEIVREVRALGLETCMTLGMLTAEQAHRLKEAGLDFYNHNLDTSRRYYPEIISTRSYDDRLRTLGHLQEAGIKICSGGIVGMGEGREDRIDLLLTLANLDPQPESVPINLLVPIEGTPLGATPRLDVFELVRSIAVARILMPGAYVRLSAGRESLSDEGQALCFHAGANSIFYGDKLLTTGNARPARDQALFERLGLTIQD
jgi:biotin synthase